MNDWFRTAPQMTAECVCVEGCQLADQFTPATRELMVFTKSKARFFDLDAVREPHKYPDDDRSKRASVKVSDRSDKLGAVLSNGGNPAGAPPLDWWLIPYTDPTPTPRQGEPMTATFYVGDAIEVMSKLPEKSVDLILTSPPFLALRSYLPADHPDKALEGGSQSTPGEFIDWLLDVVDACARVLAPHGSLVFELGDTYSGSGESGWERDKGDYRRENRSRVSADGLLQQTRQRTGWPQAKSLSLIPESFRWAMVYGHNPFTGRECATWRLRNVIRWVRPNPPVGALGDKFRPATSELMVFCKAKDRFFDLDAVRESPKEHSLKYHDAETRGRHGNEGFQVDTRGDGGRMTHGLNPAGAPPLDWWKVEGSETRELVGLLIGDDEFIPQDLVKYPFAPPSDVRVRAVFAEPGKPILSAGAPPLDWWNIPPGGYSGAHYAVFPPELLIKPIKAMCPAFVCERCGLALGLGDDKSTVGSAESMRGMRSGDSRSPLGQVSLRHEGSPVLLADLPESTYLSESEVHQGLGAEHQGLHPDSPSRPSNGQSGGLRHGASSSDGGTPRPGAVPVGSGSSQERNQGRQPDRELGTVDESGARQTAQATTETPSLPSLRRVDSDASECPSCGGPLRSGRVLDPFGGSGTTALVATGHGRDCILIDLDSRNFDLALDRVGPLVLSRGEETA